MLERIKNSFLKRDYLFENDETDCFRLLNSEGDGIEGLTVDLYGEFLLVQYFNRYIDELLTRETSLINSIINVAALLPVTIRGVLVKNRLKNRSLSGMRHARESHLVDGVFPESGYYVKQNGVYAYVDLLHGQNTGLFLDMREVRENLKSFYSHMGIKRMANLFSYTSIFSVHGLKYGIEHSVNVDLSKGVLRRAMENYKLNLLPVDHRDFIHGDAFKWTGVFKKKYRSFNFIIFDPPTFSRNKRRNFSAKKDYPRMLKILENISDMGYILTSVNSYSISKDEYIGYHPPHWKNLQVMHESSDFVNQGVPYLKVGIWKI